MSNLPNSTIKLIPPTLRGGYCPDSWTEFARTIVGGTSAQHNLDRGTTFYNFGNQPVFPTPEPPEPQDPCESLDFEVDWEPAAHDPTPTLSFAIDLDNPDLNGATELVFTGATYSPPPFYENPWVLKFNTTVTSISFPCCTTFTTGILIRSMPALQEVRFDSLTGQNGANWNWYDPVDGGDPALSVWQSISIKGNQALVTVSLPLLINSGGMNISDNTLLESIDFPNLFPVGRTFNFSGNALTEQSVNEILAIFAASSWQGFFGSPAVLNLSGGTNAAPTGQGLVDKATLAARPFVTVTTN